MLQRAILWWGNGAPGAALAECYGRDVDWMAPEPESVVQTAPDTVTVRFSRIRNWLNPFGVPAALLPFEAEDAAACRPESV